MTEPLSSTQVQIELAAINDQDSWPHWPVLPVKEISKPANERRHGIVLASDLTTVWLINLFTLKSGKIAPQLAGHESIKFSTVEEMVASGWIGD